MIKRRALVLTDETARHPFLQSLPPHVRRIDPEAAMEPQAKPGWSLGFADIRQFLTAYCATFVAVMVFTL